MKLSSSAGGRSTGDKAVAALIPPQPMPCKRPQLDAFRDAACYLSGIFFLGLVALIFLPATKSRPLPE